MRSYFNINIKGKTIWKLCALVSLGFFLTCCLVQIASVDQPTAANANDVITITTNDTLSLNADRTTNYVIGILTPVGFDGAHNITNVQYKSGKGDGPMSLMSPTIIEPSTNSNGTGTNLSFAASMKAHFKVGQNIVDNLEWVVFEGNQQVSVANGDHIGGTISFQMKVGVDGNTTIYKPSYVICEVADGLNYYDPPDPYWGKLDGPLLTVTGPGDLVDLYNPQLTSFDPAKSLDNDFVTITYNNKLDTAGRLKGPNYYLCVDTLITSDNKITTNICSQTVKAQLVQTSSNSGLYKLTFWPHSFFGLGNDVTATQMMYHIIDSQGNKVGFADTETSFIYKYKCK
jgi:hypothetical protein